MSELYDYNSQNDDRCVQGWIDEQALWVYWLLALRHRYVVGSLKISWDDS
jgi:hypothetical protein